MCMTLVSCWMLTACDHQPLATDGDGEFVIVGKCAPTEVAAALKEHLDATLVVDFGPDTANLTAAANAAGRATPPFTVAVGQAPQDGTEIADAVIVGAATTAELFVAPPPPPLPGSVCATDSKSPSGGLCWRPRRRRAPAP